MSKSVLLLAVTSRVTARGECVVILDDSKHPLFDHNVSVVRSLCACPRTMPLCRTLFLLLLLMFLGILWSVYLVVRCPVPLEN